MKRLYDFITKAGPLLLGCLVGVLIAGCSSVPVGEVSGDPKVPSAAAPLPAAGQLEVKCSVEGDSYVVELRNPTRVSLRYYTFKTDVSFYRPRFAHNPLDARVSVRGPVGSVVDCDGHQFGASLCTGSWDGHRVGPGETKRIRLRLAGLFDFQGARHAASKLLDPNLTRPLLSYAQMRAARLQFRIRVAIMVNPDRENSQYVECESDWHDF